MKMAEGGNHDIPRGLATPTRSFRNYCLAFRLTPPLKLVEAMGLEPILGILPDRLPQSPYLFGYTPIEIGGPERI